ncbi:hypothetical protein F5141DRAFT_321914 [Pisolithus sp. B1]|nr:hypothetical protein F5141DRAFT_321914 [Pisolithus sp. B1]
MEGLFPIMVIWPLLPSPSASCPRREGLKRYSKVVFTIPETTNPVSVCIDSTHTYVRIWYRLPGVIKDFISGAP